MIFSNADGGSKPRRHVAVRASTVLLLLALLGLALRMSDAAPALQQRSGIVALVLVGLAPVWAMLAGMLSTLYLMLGMWRPYSTVQHLVEMAAAVALIAAMQPAHLG